MNDAGIWKQITDRLDVISRRLERIAPITIAPTELLKPVSSETFQTHPLLNAKFPISAGAIGKMGLGQVIDKDTFKNQVGLAGDELLLIRSFSFSVYRAAADHPQIPIWAQVVVYSTLFKTRIPFYYDHVFPEPMNFSLTGTIHGFTQTTQIITDLSDVPPNENIFEAFAVSAAGRTTSPSPSSELDIQFEVLGRRKQA